MLMPKRQRITLDSLADWEWLSHCAVRAAKGKRQRESVQLYFSNFERSTACVREALLQARLPEGWYARFDIRDPKSRTIHAAPFVDRVAHHALIGKMAPRFEKSWTGTSYACRPHKGSHAAILQALKIAQESEWCIKLDVHSYFAYIDHDILLGLLDRLFKGSGLFHLLDTVLKSYSVCPGRGLPIGALTSQYFANHYLDGLQRELRCLSSVNAEIRYMDDLWIGCHSREAAGEIVALANEWLLANRKLRLKPACIQRSSIGQTFCGFKISSNGLRLGLRRRRAILRQYKNLAIGYEKGTISERRLQSQSCSIAALAKPGDHRVLMRQLIGSSGLNKLC